MTTNDQPPTNRRLMFFPAIEDVTAPRIDELAAGVDVTAMTLDGVPVSEPRQRWWCRYAWRDDREWAVGRPTGLGVTVFRDVVYVDVWRLRVRWTRPGWRPYWMESYGGQRWLTVGRLGARWWERG